jgi:hypothetical protein
MYIYYVIYIYIYIYIYMLLADGSYQSSFPTFHPLYGIMDVLTVIFVHACATQRRAKCTDRQSSTGISKLKMFSLTHRCASSMHVCLLWGEVEGSPVCLCVLCLLWSVLGGGVC